MNSQQQRSSRRFPARARIDHVNRAPVIQDFARRCCPPASSRRSRSRFSTWACSPMGRGFVPFSPGFQRSHDTTGSLHANDCRRSKIAPNRDANPRVTKPRYSVRNVTSPLSGRSAWARSAFDLCKRPPPSASCPDLRLQLHRDAFHHSPVVPRVPAASLKCAARLHHSRRVECPTGRDEILKPGTVARSETFSCDEFGAMLRHKFHPACPHSGGINTLIEPTGNVTAAADDRHQRPDCFVRHCRARALERIVEPGCDDFRRFRPRVVRYRERHGGVEQPTVGSGGQHA